jgi:hypothetical protein
VTLTASGGSDGDGAVYQWGTGATVGNNVLGTTAVNTYEVSPDAATTYWVRRIGATACTNTTGGTTVTIAAENAPTNITLTPSNTYVCSGSATTLTATAGAASYSFNNGSSWQASNTVTISVWSSDVTCTVKARFASGCEVTATARVYRDPESVSAATITGNNTNTCSQINPPFVSLNATASNATTFTWYKDGQQVPNVTSSYYSATATGDYSVRGKNAYCTGAGSNPIEVTIRSNSNCIPRCTGFRVYQTTSSYDGNVYTNNTGFGATASSYCTSRGARLPEYSELNCMCSQSYAVPGGYMNTYYLYLYYDGTYKFFDSSCNDPSVTPSYGYFRCVIAD